MCTSRPSAPPPAPEPTPPAPPPITQVTQGSARPAGFSDENNRDMSTASSYDKKRVGSSVLRIPIIGGY